MPEIPFLPGPEDPLPLRPTPPHPPKPGDLPPIRVPEPTPVPEPEPAPTPEPPVYPVPPKPPRQPGSLPDLWVIAGLIVALGIALLASALADFFNWFLRTFLPPPLRNRAPQVNPQQFTQAITNRLGAAEAAFDNEVGASFHKMAGVVARLGTLLVAVAQTELDLARRQTSIQTRQAQQGHAIVNAAGSATAAGAGAAAAGAAARTEAKHARQVEHALQERIRKLEHYQTHVLEPELEALRAQIPELHKGQTSLWGEVDKHSGALTVAGVTAATAVALDRLGGGWIRCEANQLLGRANCGNGPESANNLLKLLLGTTVLLNLRQYVELEQKVAEPAVKAVKLILRA